MVSMSALTQENIYFPHESLSFGRPTDVCCVTFTCFSVKKPKTKSNVDATLSFRCRGKAPATWPTTWPSKWTTRTPSPCRSRASRRRSAGRTCTSCSTSTPSSPIPPGFWRRAPPRTAWQVGDRHSASGQAPLAFLVNIVFLSSPYSGFFPPNRVSFNFEPLV